MRHIASVHEGKKPFNCSVCGASLLKSGGPEDTCCKNMKGHSSVTFAMLFLDEIAACTGDSLYSGTIVEKSQVQNHILKKESSKENHSDCKKGPICNIKLRILEIKF